MNRIGIDLGGTKIEGILLDEDLNILERKRIATDQEEGYIAIVDRIVNLIKHLQTHSIQDCSIGICTPGAISAKTGRLKNSNTVCMIGQPLKEDLESALNQSIAMDNDANCFSVAEGTMGAAKDYKVVFGVIMGTGVGGGIVINGHVHRGPNHIAGEWGHHRLIPDGRTCYCGKNGCVETYISGPALERRWKELSKQSLGLKKILSYVEFKPLAENVKKWKSEFLEHFGQALANVIDILDPDAIVLGGGLSNIPFLYDQGVRAVYKRVFSDSVDTPILKNRLGDSAGVFGAALLKVIT